MKTERKLVGFLFALMVFWLVPRVTVGATEAPTSISMSGEQLYKGDSSTDGNKWNTTTSGSTTVLSLPAGSYKLTSDITTTVPISVDGEVTLDLNGFGIKFSNSENSVVISIEESKKLTLTDSNSSSEHKYTVANDGLATVNDTSGTSSFTGGYITGGSGGIFVNSNSTLNMQGGTIIGNSASQGGGVYVFGTFNMQGGTIIGNTASDSGGGVYNNRDFTMSGGKITCNTASCGGGGVYVNYGGGTFNLSGNVKITGNKFGNDIQNVYVNENKTVTITGTLGEAASIGVTYGSTDGKGVFAVAGSDYTTGISDSDKAKFKADNANLAVAIKEENSKNVLELKEGLTPVSYIDHTVSGSTITAETKSVNDYTVVADSTDPVAWTAGWYAVNSEVTISNQITFSGDIHLILCDGAKLTVNGGLKHDDDSNADNLFIYAQSTGDTMGVMNVNSGSTGDAINSNGSITINCGKINASGMERGISASSTITINGGTVTSSGKSRGIFCSSGKLTINNGSINASADGNGAGIHTGDLKVSGGTVVASGGSGESSIGIEAQGSGANVTISGGDVTATGNSKAINGGVNNSIPGTGWESVDGSGTGTTIETGSSATGKELTYKKVHFKAKETPSPVPGPNPDPSPSGGGSSDPTPQPSGSTYTGKVEGSGENTESATISATIENGTATIAEVTSTEITKVAEATTAGQTTSLVLDVSGAPASVTSIEIPKATVENIAAAAGDDSSAINGATIKLPTGDIEFDATATQSINDQAQGDSVKIEIAQTKQEELTAAQQETLKNENLSDAKVVGVSVTSGSSAISDFNGGKARISFADKAPQWKNPNYYHMYFLNSAGELFRMPTTHMYDIVQFMTGHNSEYVLVYDETDLNENVPPISGAVVENLIYTGTEQAVKVSSVTADAVELKDTILPADAYTLSGDVKVKDVGTYKVVITAKDSGGYRGSTEVTYEVKKADQKLSVTAKDVKAKRGKKIKPEKVFTIENAVGKVKYTKVEGDKKIKISDTGKIKIKKNLKKGKYTVTVLVSSEGDGNYNTAEQTVEFVIKVK